MCGINSTETKNKKEILNNVFIKTASVVFLMFALVLHNPFPSMANEVDDLRREQQERQQELDRLNAEIREQQREINRLVTQTNTLQNHIALFSAQINQTTAQISATETRVELTNAEIIELRREIRAKETAIADSRERLSELIRTLYEMDRTSSGLLALMNNDNLSDFLNAVAQITNLQGRSYELLQEIKEAKALLELRETELETRRAELREMQRNLTEQRHILQEQVVAKNDLLTITRGQEQRYRELLSESQAQENRIQREIQNLENEIRQRLGQRVSPGQRGLFIWPMQGTLTQRYAPTNFTALGYDFHNGIDVAAPPGTPIVAPYAGRVSATDQSNFAYGNWVTIEHELPGGRSVVTLYAHMLRISVSPGQEVRAGQVIGTQGNTGNTTRLLYGPHRGFHLHFTVFDQEGFRIVPGAFGNYRVPVGFTYDPMEFL